MSETENKVLNQVGSVQVKESIDTSVEYYDLKESSKDAAIEENLPENHLFDDANVYVQIGVLIARQSNGEDGPLLTDGRINLFYTGKRVVGVRRRGAGWFVFAWRRVELRWFAESRVFSPATVS